MAARAGINLLPQEFREPGKLQEVRKLLSKTTAGLLIAYLVIVLAIATLLFIFSRQLRSLSQENEMLGARIDALRQREGFVASLKNRTSLARKIFTEAPAPEDRVDKVFSLLPAGVEILEMTAEGTTLVVSLRTPTSQDFAALLERVRGGSFGKVVLKTLNLSGQGGYILSLEVN